MKTVLCFLVVLVAYAHARGQGIGTLVRDVGSIQDSVRRYITDYHYPAEIYEVQTEDGYYLEIVRIPYGRHHNLEGNLDNDVDATTQQRHQQREQQGTESEQRPPIILMPGMMATYENFVIGGPTEGLAFRLADEGYDVYMCNVRGSFYGQKHKTYDAERDVAFWRYSFEEIGTKDIPAIIDKVLSVSGKQQAYFIGHMQGATAFYVMASERPEYVDKIALMISLGPVAYMDNTDNAFLTELDKKIREQENYYTEQLHKNRGDVWTSAFIASELGINSYDWSSELLNTVKTEKCVASGYTSEICKNIYFLVNGYNSRTYNETTVQNWMQRTPSPVSSKQILHHVQTMISGGFQKYIKNFDRTNQEHWQGNQYDLSKLTRPVVVYYAPEDTWCREQDVQRLMKELPNVVHHRKIDTVTNNLDLLFTKDVNTRVYDSIVRSLSWDRTLLGGVFGHTRTGRRTTITV